MKRIALLRGVNVGAHRKVAMSELRSALGDSGLGDVETYIQSGNIVFSGGPGDDSVVVRLVEDVIADRFGLDDVPVVVRSLAELTHARSKSERPFPVGDVGRAAGEHAKRMHIVFLTAVPPPTRRASLDPDAFGADRFHLDIHDGVADLHVAYAVGAGSSKLTTDRIERGFGVRATGRNLTTVDRLIEMATATDPA